MTKATDVEAIRVARYRCAVQRPYLATALWALRLVEAKGIGSMGVDKWWRLYYDPEALARWSSDELEGVLIHEVNHLLRDTAGRFPVGGDHVLWNIAADMPVNVDIINEGLKLFDGVVFPKTFGFEDGLLAEEYYELLMKNVKVVQLYVGGTGSADKPAPGQGRCGSGASGRQEPWELGPPPAAGAAGSKDKPSTGTADADTSGVGQAEGDLIRREVARSIKEAAKGRGDVPGSWERWADDMLRPPKVDWRRVLAGEVRHALTYVSGASDYTYRRPSRRRLPGIVLPSLYRPSPSIAVVIDTSGSIGPVELSAAMVELRGILLRVGVDAVNVYATDAAVAWSGRVRDISQVKLAGGGGTDMGVGLDAAERGRPRPDAIVVLTDGMTPWPETPPRAKVVVALLGAGTADEESHWHTPDWATTVVVELEDAA